MKIFLVDISPNVVYVYVVIFDIHTYLIYVVYLITLSFIAY